MFKLYNFIISNLIIFFFILEKFLQKRVANNYEVIIFSYNRPLQLESLLKSLKKFLDPRIKLNILFKNDPGSMNICYKKLISKYQLSKNINFVEQKGDFKKSLLKLLRDIKMNNHNDLDIIFFVDDQILYRKIKIESLHKLSKLAAISTFRIVLNTKLSYNLNKYQNLKNYNFKKEKNCVSWYPKFIKDDISYVFSFDGSTIPLLLVWKLSHYLIFKGPNSLESSINYGDLIYKLLRQKISSFHKQCAVNIVISKVQNETDNRGSFMKINKLKDLFIKNWELKLDKNEIEDFNSPHIKSGFYFQNKNKKKYID